MSSCGMDFLLRDLDCVTCALRLEKGLRNVSGVMEVHANLILGKVTVAYDYSLVEVSTLEKNIEGLGHKLLLKRYKG